MNIYEYSVKRPIVIVIVLISIALLGIFSINRLPLLFLPDTSFPSLFIQIPYKSTSPEEIKNLITSPMEGAMGGVSRLKKIGSTSSSNNVSIRLEFEIGTDMDLASMEVRDRIDQVRSELPDDVGRIRVRRFQTTDSPIMNYSLAWDGTQSELNDVVQSIVVPRLLRIDGVADVDVQGIRNKEITIDLNNDSMKAYGVGINDITQSLSKNNVNLSGGYVLDGGRKYVIRSMGELEDISEIPLLPVSGSRVKIGDVGKITFDYPEKTFYQRLNNVDAVSMSIFKSSTANIVEVSRRVKGVLEEIKSDPKMDKLTAHVFFDQSDEITKGLRNLRDSGIVGGALTVVVLFLFLWKVRSTLIIALAIPLSLLYTLAFMFLLRRFGASNITINIISLSGLVLAVGMLVDNSVVVLENIFRHKEEGEGPIEAAIKGSSEVGTAVTASTLTTIIVFVPLVFMSKTSFGRFMGDFGLTIVTALVASLLVAFTLVPLIASRLFIGEEKKKHKVIDWMKNRYAGVIGWTLKYRLVTLLIAISIMGGSIYLFSKIEREAVPPSPSRRMDITVEAPRSAPLSEVKEVFDQVEKDLLKHKEDFEIKMISTNFRAGRSRITVFFKDIGDSKYNTTQLQNKVRGILPQVPGYAFRVGRGFGIGGGELGVSVELKGPDSGVMSVLAEDVKGRLGAIGGVKDVDTSLESGSEEMRVEVDRARARKYGLSSSQVAQAISANLGVGANSSFKALDEEIPIKVQLKEEDRATLQQLKQVGFEKGGNDATTLGTLADFRIEKGPLSIRRDDGNEIVTVSASTERQGMSGLSGEIGKRLRDLRLPPGYSWQMGGNFRQFQESQQLSRFAIILAVALIYLVIASLFESFIHPITILLSVPFSITGVAVLFYLTGTTLNNNSWLGVMVLFGIVVNNSIILIDHINGLRKSGMGRREAVTKAGQDRLRPILITALTTILGLFPTVAPVLFPSVFGPIEGRAALYGPIALALFAGLTTSTFLTLIVIPTFYTLIDDLGVFFKRAFRYTVR